MSHGGVPYIRDDIWGYSYSAVRSPFGRGNPQPLFWNIKRICILYGHTLGIGYTLEWTFFCGGSDVSIMG